MHVTSGNRDFTVVGIAALGILAACGDDGGATTLSSAAADADWPQPARGRR